ncbi:dynein intermediate chain [Holotrichia oblita]|uniref:Dynein intermediate chain n=2 Tax=Holotrichia oblita TaxID=644536 RepID=A0ACB9SRV3_HOLOL|nr:dynein intermediate chain [Holotrichia oblita]
MFFHLRYLILLFQTQTDEVSVPTDSDVDLNKLSDWLQKIYPRVSRELNDSINSSAFKNYRVARSTEPPVVKLIQTIKVQDSNSDNVCRVSTLSWNATGNTLAVACNQFHKTWCYHPGSVFLYTFDRYDKMPDTPNKRLATETCITVIRFHPRSPSIIAAGSQSGRYVIYISDIILWNIQHDDGENIICKTNAHEELVTHMDWINDMDIAKTPLLATSSLDGCLTLWNFDPADAIIKLKHKYHVKSPILPKMAKSPTEPEEISKKIIRGIVTFDFSPYVPDMFIVGAEGGLFFFCFVGSTNDVPISDPVYKYYNPHEGEIRKISFSPNRKEMFLTCGTDGEVRIYILGQVSIERK